MHAHFLSLALLVGAAAAAPRLAKRSSQSSSQVVAVGAHVIYSYAGTSVPDALHQLVDEGMVGGVILFGDNVDSSTPQAMQDLQSTWSSSASYNGVPLLITTDQEGGEVKRLPGGPDLSEKDVGAASDPSAAATTAGQQAASILLQYHNNGNLAPVCGVFRTPGDFLDQYERSYSNQSSVAAECAAAFVKAQQAGGAVTTAKHFPGLGAATADEDTDSVPVTLTQSFDDLLNIDMPPFQAAVSAGTAMVMPSWAYYPALDSEFPAGLSSKWLQDELRGRLGFTGVTISDSIEAGGLEAFGSDDGYRATLASSAGMDIILAAARDPTQGSGIVNTLVDALNNKTLDQTNFDASTQRILNLRKGLST